MAEYVPPIEFFGASDGGLHLPGPNRHIIIYRTPCPRWTATPVMPDHKAWIEDPDQPGTYCWYLEWLASGLEYRLAFSDPHVAFEFRIRHA